MSIFNGHRKGYLKNEINGNRIGREIAQLNSNQGNEQVNGTVKNEKQNGTMKNGTHNIIRESNTMNAEEKHGKKYNTLRNDNLNGTHENGKGAEIHENGQHNGRHENRKVNETQEDDVGNLNGIIENGKRNGTSKIGKQNGTLEYGKLNDRSESSSVSGDDIDTFVPICKPGRFICRGFYTDVAHLCSETGYLIWIEPKKNMHVLFTYGDTNCDFLCYLEPEVPGVAINYLEPNRIKRFQYFNESDYRAVQIHSGLAASINGSSGTRYSCMGSLFNTYSYAIDSESGQCFIELSVLNKKQMCELTEPICRPFKLNFRLVL
ncbi:unnamed protein product [Heterobilharzia americana]|nr:unnamed protein product [Heterobilharzia americana]